MTLRNTLVSIACGLLFSLGWWLLIDGIVQSNIQTNFNPFLFVYSFPAIFGTLSGIALNMVSKEHVLETDNVFGPAGAGSVGSQTRMWVFVCITVSFVCIGSAGWVMGLHYEKGEWPGVALLLNTIFVFFSGLAFFMARK